MNPAPQPNPARARGKRAFSLVETAIAIGIVAFAMIGILGMIPVGLTTFRSAMNRTVETAIVQSVTATLQLADYENLAPDEEPPQFRFDEQGNRLQNPDDPACIYVVKTEHPLPLDSSDSTSPDPKALVNPEAGYRVLFTVTPLKGGGVINRYNVILPRNH